MDSDYMLEAMRRADIKFVTGEASFRGVIKECPGVSATGCTFEECRTNLLEALDNWLFVRQATGLYIPPLGKVAATQVGGRA